MQPDPGPHGSAAKSCLVVDDSRVLRKVVSRMLVDLHFAVEEAEDGAAALTACERAMPDAILLDWNMPVMSGIEFVKRLRAMEGGSAPVVVFCTTERKIEQIQQAIAAGADEYIMKPFDIGILEAKFAQEGLL
jgi:two-component system, chemotaxis family, chemotaxis protein CheY